MKSKPLTDAQPKTDEEYKREIDRMAIEIRAMLDESGRRLEHARHIRAENQRALADLEKRILCGNA